MENVVSSFPLLRLPFSVQQRVARSMDRLEQLAFSILCEETTSVVKSLKNKLYSATISIRHPLQLTLMFRGISKLSLYFGYGEGRDGEYKSVERRPESLRLVYRSWTLPGLEDLDVEDEDEDDSDVDDGWVVQDGERHELHGIAEENDVEEQEEEQEEPEDGEHQLVAKDAVGEDGEQLDEVQEVEEAEFPAIEIALEMAQQEVNDDNEMEEDLGGMGATVNAAWKPNLTLRDWILHIMNIYHDSHIDSLVFHNRSLVYYLSCIKTALRGVDIRTIAIREPDDEEEMDNEVLVQMITKLFHPIKRLNLDLNFQLKDPDHLQRILLSNYDYLAVSPMLNTYFTSLDRLLSNNASTISICCSTLTSTTINKFLKMWIRGAMPRLKRFMLNFYTSVTVLSKDDMLNGLEGIERRQNERRTGMFDGDYGVEKRTVRGGFSIKRLDGVEGTVQFEEPIGRIGFFDFYVWDR